MVRVPHFVEIPGGRAGVARHPSNQDEPSQALVIARQQLREPLPTHPSPWLTSRRRSVNPVNQNYRAVRLGRPESSLCPGGHINFTPADTSAPDVE